MRPQRKKIAGDYHVLDAVAFQSHYMSNDNRLAIERGLITKKNPSPKLTSLEWEEVTSQSNLRKDFQDGCPICHDDFGLQKQVILSCSHVFHASCLHSYENYTKKRVCPMCRHNHYQVKEIQTGKDFFIEASATKIQKVFRGYLARKQYKQMWEQWVPHDPSIKASWQVRKLTTTSDKLIEHLDVHHAKVAHEMDDIDLSLSRARDLYKLLDDHLEQKNVTIGDNLLPSSSSSSSSNIDTVSLLLTKAKQRNQIDCPICLTHLHGRKENVILSCSHLFHLKCISSFETFNVKKLDTCPVCRAFYTKFELNTIDIPCNPYFHNCIESKNIAVQNQRVKKDIAPKTTKTLKRNTNNTNHTSIKKRPSKPPSRKIASNDFSTYLKNKKALK